ncbi:MAG: nitronate monooxygenase [Solirubrobacteraceae bacterium]
MAPGTPILAGLAAPIVQAPLAGGPSTPALAAAVNRGGGLGFLAAGYLSPERLAQDIETTRHLITGGFGVNVFVTGGQRADPHRVRAYAERLDAEARRAGVALGEPRFDDDAFAEKIDLLCKRAVAVVSFTFGAPSRNVIEGLHAAGSEVWLTVTSPAEARQAVALGADAVIVQGIEAGGHRAVFVDDDEQSELTLLAALQLVRRSVELPLIAAGSITTGAALGAVLVAGASAGQVGTAYMRSTEAGTSDAHRTALATDTTTVLTRAFSGRTARGITNRWHREHGTVAPRAYPEIHHLTSPLRGHGRAVGDPDLVNLWAGQAHALAQERSAEQITRLLAVDARAAVSRVAERLAGEAGPGLGADHRSG